MCHSYSHTCSEMICNLMLAVIPLATLAQALMHPVSAPSSNLQPSSAGSVSMPVTRLKNRKCTSAECVKIAQQDARNAARIASQHARDSARIALREWYTDSFHRANVLLPGIQIDENFESSKKFPEWKASKDVRDGYIMLTTIPAGRTTPVTMHLNYKEARTGGLTYRSLIEQVRNHLSLAPKESLRICPFRPWYHYMTERMMVPESRAIPCSHDQCRHLLGTTMICYIHTSMSISDR